MLPLKAVIEENVLVGIDSMPEMQSTLHIDLKVLLYHTDYVVVV